jgi:acyl-coenzyme A thioesterase PaaI-like protein
MDAAERLNVRDDHGCFGCGHLNSHGLRLDFYATAEGDGVWAAFTPAPEHEGFAGVVHGGIVTAALDEAMGWAVFVRGVWAVTAKIGVAFRRPVGVGEPTRVIGWVASDRGRLLEASGELRRAADGALLAEATATFARVPAAQARAWEERYGVGVPEGAAEGTRRHSRGRG